MIETRLVLVLNKIALAVIGACMSLDNVGSTVSAKVITEREVNHRRSSKNSKSRVYFLLYTLYFFFTFSHTVCLVFQNYSNVLKPVSLLAMNQQDQQMTLFNQLM